MLCINYSEIQDGLRSRIEATRADYPNFRPGLTIVQVIAMFNIFDFFD